MMGKTCGWLRVLALLFSVAIFLFSGGTSAARVGGVLERAAPSTEAVFACDAAKNPLVSSFGFCDTSLGIEARAADLVSRLTLDEKVGALQNKAGAVERLGIPEYEWWSEALHGVSYVGPGTHFDGPVPGATSFPQVIHTAASFNTTLFYTIGKVVSTEARAMYNLGLAGLTFWSPNVNIFRDPRWGRGQETPGEDPVLTSKYAVGYVRGLQEAEGGDSNHLDRRLKVASCCKHYTAYDLDEWKGNERFTFDAKVTKQDMDDTFQPPFKSCVLEGNVASVMCSFNKVNGVPTCADPDLLAGTIRGDWKLNGYIVSDCDSVDVIYNDQNYTKTPEEAAAKTILAGLDLDCGTFLANHTKAAVARGLLKLSDIDKAVTNNMAMLLRLGFFDGNPKKGIYGSLGAKDVCSQQHQDLAREAARQGVVLLKNDNSVLPLSPSVTKSLAVIGPNANVTKAMIGNYEGTPCSYVTPLQGLTALVSTIYQSGCLNVTCTADDLQLDAAKQAAKAADATVLVMGTDLSIEREGLDRVNLTLPGQQEVLVSEVAAASTGPVILVIMSGGPFDITFAKKNEKISGILWTGFPGEKGGAALADVIFGLYNPSGRLPVTWYPQSFTKVSMTDMHMRPDKATGYPGRTYRFYTGDVVYAFGDGLSYTTFEHRLAQVPPERLVVPLEDGHACRTRRCGSVEVTDSHCRNLVFDVRLSVQNSGGTSGDHTVLLFSTPPAVHNAPRKHLVAFERMAMAPKESVDRVFEVDVCRDLSVVDETGLRKVALGHYLLHVGDLTHSFELTT